MQKCGNAAYAALSSLLKESVREVLESEMCVYFVTRRCLTDVRITWIETYARLGGNSNIVMFLNKLQTLSFLGT